MLNNPELAEDATQEVFTRAMQSLTRFIPFADHKTWLYKIATNVCLNMMSKASYKREISAETEEIDIIELTPDNQPDQRRNILEIEEFMKQSLTADEKQVFALRLFDDLNYEEIAEQLGCTKRTIINRMNSIKEKYIRWDNKR